MTLQNDRIDDTSRGSILRNLRAGRAGEVLSGIAALACLLAVSVSSRSMLPFALAVLTLIAIALMAAMRNGTTDDLGRFTLTRVLLAGVLLPIEAPLAFALLILGLIAESACRRILRAQAPVSSNLPGCRIAEPKRIAGGFIVFESLLALVLVVWLTWTPVSWWIGAVVAAVPLSTAVVIAARGIHRIRSRRNDVSRMASALTAYAPEFVVHWDALPGTAYQLRMWLPQLERTGRRFFVIARNPDSYPEAVANTSHPVVYRPELEDLEDVVLPTLRAAFYVNNATRNVQLIRFADLQHVQLNHGESEKAPSYSPSLRAYDRNFVAGQAAIDRFAAHGVPTHDDFFRVVGRPQAVDIAISTVDSIPDVSVVLYAPTWAGFHADSAYSSLAFGERIVERLLARGLTVVFRPHPHNDMNPQLREHAVRVRELLAADRSASGRPHLFGSIAEIEMSITDCFNAADALISDVSSVAADFLASGKPFAVSQVRSDTLRASPPNDLVSGGYPFDSSPTSIEAVIDALRLDPLRGDRLRRRAYVLGPLPVDAVRAFEAAVTEVLGAGR